MRISQKTCPRCGRLAHYKDYEGPEAHLLVFKAEAVFMAATALSVLRMQRWFRRKTEEASIAANSKLRWFFIFFLCYAAAVFGETFKAKCFVSFFGRRRKFFAV